VKVVIAHRSPTAKISQAQYERYRPDIERLYADKGRSPSSSEIAKAAKNPNISFHDFIYSESTEEAAWQRRLEKARDLMQSFHITFVDSDGEEAEGREWVNVTVITEDGPEERYMKTSDAVAMVPYKTQMIARCLTDLKALERRYSPFLQRGKSKAILLALKALIALVEGTPEIKKSKAA
jgi:hypothetical protein